MGPFVEIIQLGRKFLLQAFPLAQTRTLSGRPIYGAMLEKVWVPCSVTRT